VHRATWLRSRSATLAAALAVVLAGAGRGTRVRSPERDRLLAALEQKGIAARPVGDDGLSVDAEAAAVGETAAAERIVLHELGSDAGTLEEVFLELTEGASTPA